MTTWLPAVKPSAPLVVIVTVCTPELVTEVAATMPAKSPFTVTLVTGSVEI